jgi:hypothetical protein
MSTSQRPLRPATAWSGAEWRPLLCSFALEACSSRCSNTHGSCKRAAFRMIECCASTACSALSCETAHLFTVLMPAARSSPLAVWVFCSVIFAVLHGLGMIFYYRAGTDLALTSDAGITGLISGGGFVYVLLASPHPSAPLYCYSHE